jgi:hypothetical protein
LNSEGPVFESNECIDGISKIISRGAIRRIGKPRYDICDSPPCKSFKAKHNFSCVLRPNLGCDTKIGKFFTTATVRPNFTSTITQGLILNGEGRGAHHGKFTIVGRDGLRASGILGGITNAGTHQTPPSNCEPCFVKGHMEGRLTGKITKGSLNWGRIFASYMVLFEASTEFKDTPAKGSLEGVIVRDCA